MARRVVSFTLACLGAGVLLAAPAGAADTPEVSVLVQRARLWVARDRPDLAREALQRLSRVAPGHPGGLAVKAELELRAGAADAARATLEQLRQADPRHPEIDRIETLLRLEGPDKAKLREVRLLVKTGRTAQAIAALRALYPKGPPAGELALEYWQLIGSSAEDWAAARDALADLARQDPDNPRYAFALAEHELGRAPLNTRALQKVIEMARLPAFARQAHAAWRRAVLRLDAEPASVKLLDDYLAVEPGDTAARERRDAVVAGVQARRRLAADPAYRAGQQGLALLERGELDAAGPLLERAMAARANDAEIVGGMGLLRLRQGRHAQAQAHFSHALRLDPGNASKWRGLEETARVWSAVRASGDALQRGDAVAAERLARDALRIAANHADATLALARAQMAQGQMAQAGRSYRAALNADPLNASAFRGLVKVQGELGEPAVLEQVIAGLTAAQRTAFADVLKSVRLDALREQAERMVAAGRPADAMRALERVVQLAPDDAWPRYRLARLHADQGAPETGRALLDQLLQQKPTDAAALHASALFQAGLDENEAALATLARIPAPERSAAVLRLERRLAVQLRSQRALALARSGDRSASSAVMIDAEMLAQGDADASLSVARGWLDQGELGRAGGLLDRVESSVGTESAGDLAALRSAVLYAEAKHLMANQQLAQAGTRLERALALAPNDVWLRYDLAQLYARQGDAQRGLALLAGAAGVSRGDPQTLHALALFQAQRDDAVAALYTLERIAPPARNGAPARTQRRLWLELHVQRAEAAARAGDGAAARRLLEKAEAAIAGDAALSTTVAAAWTALGEPEQAQRMLGEAGANAGPAARLRHAALLVQRGDRDRASALLDEIAGATGLSASERNELRDQRDGLVIDQAEQLSRAGRTGAALDLLNAQAETSPAQPAIALAQARLLRDARRYPAALERYRRALVLNPGLEAAQWEMIDTLSFDGQDERARAAVDDVLRANPRDARALRQLGALEQRQGHSAAAIKALQSAAAADWAARVAAGSVGELSRLEPAHDVDAAQGALVVVTGTPVTVANEIGRWWPHRMLARSLDLNNRWVSGALDWRFRSGSAGKSSLDMKELPIELRWPASGGQIVVHADAVRLDAGTLDLADARNARDFGQVLLCQPGCNSGAVTQADTGLALDVGFETETLRIDLGSTPLGFALQRPVGGVRVKGELGPLSYSLDVSSRPLTSSLLAYAGARDPRSGSVWGGVQASGATLTLSADDGGALGGWALLGAHRLAGTQVQSNQRRQLMGGAYWRMLNRENQQFSVGVTGVAQDFAHNAGEFSFGHGGYYSPRSQRSVSLPLTYNERGARYSYQLRAAISNSRSRTDSAPFFPTDAALQASAVAQAAGSGVNPQYEGGPGGGRGYSLAAALEYQWRPNVQLGVRLEIERSRDFEPNRALFYVRYALDGAMASPLAMPPKAVLPTSEL